MLAKLLRLTWADTRLARRLRHRRRYPGLGLDDWATVSGSGVLDYRQGAAVGAGALLNLQENTRLELGEACYVGRQVELAPGRSIRIGRAASLQDRCVILGDVSIGAYCSLAYNVYISSGRHVFEWRPQSLIKVQDVQAPPEHSGSRPVVIEEDCWLGNNVVVMSGVCIGRGAVIGANAVVTKDVPPYAVFAGVPARQLRARLNYSPPRALRFDVEDCLPYFHAGFALLGPDIEASVRLGGLLAQGAFCVALNAAGCSTLRIRLRSASESPVEVGFAGRTVSVGPAYEELEFAVDSSALLHQFTLSGVSPGVRVASVAVQ